MPRGLSNDRVLCQLLADSDSKVEYSPSGDVQSSDESEPAPEDFLFLGWRLDEHVERGQPEHYRLFKVPPIIDLMIPCFYININLMFYITSHVKT